MDVYPSESVSKADLLSSFMYLDEYEKLSMNEFKLVKPDSRKSDEDSDSNEEEVSSRNLPPCSTPGWALHVIPAGRFPNFRKFKLYINIGVQYLWDDEVDDQEIMFIIVAAMTLDMVWYNSKITEQAHQDLLTLSAFDTLKYTAENRKFFNAVKNFRGQPEFDQFFNTHRREIMDLASRVQYNVRAWYEAKAPNRGPPAMGSRRRANEAADEE